MDGEGFEPSKALLTDLQSAPFGHSGTHPNTQADDRTRTDNLLITSQLLCQLSHVGICCLIVPAFFIKALRRLGISNGTYRARTYDPLLVRQMLSQLS